ncbi:MAG: DUF2177 family protein [Vicinamibacteria bacterium]|nr:DUF2177 family protein [Vicinamibacteria bacterium]
MRYAAAYVTTLVVMLVVDLPWITVIAKSMYREGIGHLMAENANLPAAAAFYLIYVFGLVWFGIAPHASEPGVGKAAGSAALLGFIAYATYDLTNLATLRNWPGGLTLADLAWGPFVSAVSAAAGKLVFDRMA